MIALAVLWLLLALLVACVAWLAHDHQHTSDEWQALQDHQAAMQALARCGRR